MSDFMQPQIMYGDWYEVDGPVCTEWIPADLVGDLDLVDTGDEGGDMLPDELREYCQNSVAGEVTLIEGWGARLSAPGYLDCTDWTIFETEKEAKGYLEQMYDVEVE